MPSTSIPLSTSTSSTRSAQRWEHTRSYSACNTTHRRMPRFWCRAVLLCVCGFKPDALNQSCSPIALLTHPCDQPWHHPATQLSQLCCRMVTQQQETCCSSWNASFSCGNSELHSQAHSAVLRHGNKHETKVCLVISILFISEDFAYTSHFCVILAFAWG